MRYGSHFTSKKNLTPENFLKMRCKMLDTLNRDTDYIRFVSEVKELIRRSQYQALKAVNKELINLYWNIGRMIVERYSARVSRH